MGTEARNERGPALESDLDLQEGRMHSWRSNGRTGFGHWMRCVVLSMVAAGCLAASSPASAQARDHQTARRGLRPIHRIALPAAAVGTVLPLVSLLPMIPAFRDANVPGGDYDNRTTFYVSFAATSVGVGFGQMVIGSGIEAAMSRRLERNLRLQPSPAPYGRAVAGQALGYLAGLIATIPGLVYGIGKLDPPAHFSRQVVLAMHLAPPLIQAWGGSYLGAMFLQRSRPDVAPAVTFVPILSTVGGDARSIFLGTGGRF